MMQRSLLSNRPPSRRNMDLQGDPSIELRYELTKEPSCMDEPSILHEQTLAEISQFGSVGAIASAIRAGAGRHSPRVCPRETISRSCRCRPPRRS
jgi:hypothetical protein